MPLCQVCHQNLTDADGVCPSCRTAVLNAGRPEPGDRPSGSGGLFGRLSAAMQRRGGNIANSFASAAPNVEWDQQFAFGQETLSAPPSVARISARYAYVWPTWLRIFCGSVAVWAAVQVAFLAVAYSGSAPTPTAELMTTHNGAQYLASMAFHSLAILVFLCGAMLPTAAWTELKNMIANLLGPDNRDLGGWIPNLCLCFFAFGLFVVFLVSISQARYQVYIDLPSEQLIRRDIHLQPPGVTYDSVEFRDINSVRGKIDRHSHGQDNDPDKIEFHSVLSIVTTDGQEIEVGRDFPAQSSSRFAPEALSLARAIADKSGAGLELR